MREKFTQFCVSIKGVIGYLTSGVVIMLLTAWFTGSAAASTIDKTIDSRIDARIQVQLQTQVTPVLMDIKKSVDYLVSISASDYIVAINKQIEKIKSDPDDIKMTDIESILTKWNTFPDNNKTDVLIVKYNIIKDWYAKKQ